MNILIPLEITDAMLVSSSIAEPAATETAWVSGGTYALADKRIRTTVHRKYNCIQAHTGRTALPEVDMLYWEDAGPTLKWAPFDAYVNTAATATSSLNYVVSAGFADALSAYGLQGSSFNLVVKDGPGGTVLDTRTESLYDDALGLYEYLFAPARPKDKVLITGLPLHPTAEVTMTVTGAGTVALGMANLGQYRTIINGNWGGTQYGATVEPVTNSRIKTADDGTVSIKRGTAATGMRATVVLPLADANFALYTLQQVLDVPVSIISTEAEGYEGLNVFGLASAVMTYSVPGVAQIAINVKGMF